MSGTVPSPSVWSCATPWRASWQPARSYPEMAFEVERNLNRHGAARSPSSACTPPIQTSMLEALFTEPPFYEAYGERQVAAGHYRSVLRFREHFLPVARALRSSGVPREPPCASSSPTSS